MPSYGVSLQINLHTADPGEAGTATTSAPTYTGYAALTKPRDATGFTTCDGTDPYAPNAAGNAYKNATDAIFPACTGGSDSLTHVSVSVIASGQILRSTALTASLAVSNGITPLFLAGTLVWAED